jgi:hypothetical protein
MKNEALAELGWLVGEWDLTMSDAWFMEPGYVGHGTASVEWLGDAFLALRATLGAEHSTWTWVFGRNDARGQLTVLSHDERGVCRVFALTVEDGELRMEREDPDFHQRFVGTIEPDRILARTEASDDEGRTWRKDFDLTFERRRH